MVISTQNQYHATTNTAASSSQAEAPKQKPSDAGAASSSSSSPFEITDVYESSQSTSSDTSLKTYGNIVNEIKSNKQASSTTSSLLDSLSTDSSEDDEETTTELIYNADGSVYEKTTTTDEDGNETVTMTKVSDAKEKEPAAGSEAEKELASSIASTISE